MELISVKILITQMIGFGLVLWILRKYAWGPILGPKKVAAAGRCSMPPRRLSMATVPEFLSPATTAGRQELRAMPPTRQAAARAMPFCIRTSSRCTTRGSPRASSIT